MHALGQAGPKWAWPELGSFPRSWGPGPRHCGGGDLQTGTRAHRPPATGAVVLDVACFAEAERLYMLIRDTAVRGRPLTALVLPEVLVSGAKAGLGVWLPCGLSLSWAVGAKSKCLLQGQLTPLEGLRSDLTLAGRPCRVHVLRLSRV